MKLTAIFESYADYRQSRWVHYTNHEMMTMRLDVKDGRLVSFHSDPVGIYLFPENYVSETSMWVKMKYKFIATVKPNARVLDLPKISDDDLDRMLNGMGALDQFNADLQRYPLEGEKKVKRAWEILRGHPGGSRTNWNKIVRTLGYDAIFDDAGIIHFAEPIQLLVLNPAILNVIEREQPKRNFFTKMTRVVAELKDICEPFGEVTIEGPRMMQTGWSSGPKSLGARLGIRRSEKNYADFKITRGDTPNFDHIINVSLQYSRPSLNHGVGAQFNAASNVWEYRGLEGVQRDLQAIFKEGNDDD